MSVSPKTRLTGLDDEQRAAVAAPRGPVCVLAGAGTGKTRTITRRIAHLVRAGHVAPGQVLAVTFTARAAGEMRTRLRVLGVSGVQARTFHAAALRQLRYFWPQVVGGEQWQLLEGKLRFVGQAAARARAGTDAASLRDLAGEIEWAKASLVTPGDYPAAVARLRRDIPGPAEQVAAVYAGYEELKNRAELLDFDDLLLHTAAALEENRGVAEEFRDRYRCFVVDEYQDVTALQQRVLDAWLGGRDDLTVVGDANQTIYTFAGADPRHLLDFPRRFPEAVVVRLTRDYRSTPQVVSAANTLIGAARGRVAGTRLQLVGQLPPGPDPRFQEYDDEPAEAAAVARAIRRLIDDGTPAAEIAVLFRVNAQSEVYEQALTEAGVPVPGAGRGAVLRPAGGAPGDDGRPRGRGRAGRRAVAGRRPGRPGARRAHRRAARRCRAARAVGVAARAGRARRGARRRRTVGGPAPVLRRAGRPRRRRAPADGAGRDAGVAARGEGPGVGRGVPRRAGRRHAADPARRGRRRRDRGGAPPALRRRHPGAAAAVAVVGAVAPTRRRSASAPQPVPLRADPRRASRRPRARRGPWRPAARSRGAGCAASRCSARWR